MYPSLHRKVMLQSFALTLGVALLCAVVFCALFYLIPFQNRILTVFANISLGLAVFCGAFFAASRRPFFSLKKMLFLPAVVLILVVAATFAFGTFDATVFLQKTALVLVAAIFGEITGRN